MIKYNFKVLAFMLASVLVFTTSCEEGLTELNENPNDLASVEARNLIAGVQASTAHEIFYSADVTFLNMWVQHMAASSYPEEDQYVLRDGDVNNYWNVMFSRPLQDAQAIIDKSVETGNQLNLGIGKTMKVVGLAHLTNLFGDIPYSQALSGSIDKGEILTPTYDRQDAVFTGLIAELDEAIAALSDTQAAPDDIGSEDLIYGGNAQQWVRFATSLKLRLSMNLSNTGKGESLVGAVNLNNLFSSNADNAFVAYTDGNNANPVGSHLNSRDQDFRMSKTLVDMMVGTGTGVNPEDPRLPVYASPNLEAYTDANGNTVAAGGYVGIPNGLNGLGNLYTFNNTSQLGAAFLQSHSPLTLMTYAEVLFLQAEAAQRGWISGDAKALYEQAVMASMEQHGIDSGSSAVTDYLAGSASYDAASDKMELILTQKWIALFSQGSIAYDDWRRTGIPAIEPSVDNNNNNLIPRRIPYPNEEFSVNSANVNAAISAQGTAGYNGKIWWDQ